MAKIFIDTNILIYSMDQFDPEKRQRCRALLKTLRDDLRGVISTQVMQEFYVAATKKLGADPLVVKDILNSFERFETVIILPDIIKEAIDCHNEKKYHASTILFLSQADGMCGGYLFKGGNKKKDLKK